MVVFTSVLLVGVVGVVDGLSIVVDCVVPVGSEGVVLDGVVVGLVLFGFGAVDWLVWLFWSLGYV